MENVGLVLEGGGMRGVYTAGVLEYFMEENLYFPYVIGVSAGACMGASYLSRQQGRNKKINIDLVTDPRYLSFRNFIRNREIFGMDFLFDEIPNKINLFDYDSFLNGKEQFVVGTTDCETGEAVYFNKHEHGKDMLTIIRASSSLPFVAPSVSYDNRILLDGGIIDPIPIKKSKADGNVKNVVVMTKPPNYSKKRSRFSGTFKYFNKRHHKIGELLETRHELYNDTLNYLQEQRETGNVFLIQPSMEVPVSRIERNQAKLVQLYELGYEDAKHQFQELCEFLNQ